MAPQGVENSAGPGNKKPPLNIEVQDDDTSIEKTNCCRKMTNKINKGLEDVFASIGFTVATHPWKTIIISLIICGLCFIGITEYQVENRGEKLWVSQSSDALKHKDWVAEKFPKEYRLNYLMLETKGSTILTKQGLLDLFSYHEKVLKVGTGKQYINWDEICYRSSGLCIATSILELWSYNKTLISTLTNKDILEMVNRPVVASPMTNKPIKPSSFVGGPKVTNGSGYIERAKVAKITYIIIKNGTFDSGKGKLVDNNGEKWEELFEGEMKKLKSNSPGYNLFYFSEWGRGQASGDAATGDLQFFVAGYILVIIYLALMLGSFSRLSHKIYLALAGILVIGLSVGVAYGLGSAFQLKKTAVHDVLAFLLLGIGVDDVFVIVQNWENIGGPKDDGRSIPEKISSTLRHAGVSILVTSVTDMCAFFIGSSTILPALRSFCIWSGIGVLSVFILTITFFTACLSIDARRQQARRDACCCCITLSDSWEATECSKKSYLQSFIQKVYAPALVSVPGKIIGLLVVVGLLAAGAVGLSNLEQNFDFNWFLPPSTSARQYTDSVDLFFPNSGRFSAVYTGEMDYYNDHAAMNKIYDKLANDPYVAKGSIGSWYQHYHQWLNTTKQSEVNVTSDCIKTVTACKVANSSQFHIFLKEFLKHPQGKFYANNLNFPEPNLIIKAASITFQHIVFLNAKEEIRGMDAIKDEIKPNDDDTEPNKLLPFAYTFPYVSWETNKVISKELIRNLLLAALCVFLVTLFLLSHLWTALLVVLCVALALIDIAGFMHFWGLTIDTVTTIILVIAIGLTVDYSAHIAHGFMVSRKPSKNERMIEALGEIGPAVVHGGVSTFLAFILLAASESYVFETFFRVFFLVVVCGMFHGLVFLPIILSLVGPSPYAACDTDTNADVKKSQQLDEPVRLEKMKQNNETFAVITEGPVANQAYTPE